MAISSVSDQSLSGKVATVPNSELDSDRYEFLQLAQAEPNPGSPDYDNAPFTSLKDGTRSLGGEIAVEGIEFRPESLDSARDSDYYVLVASGDPFSADSSTFVKLRRLGEGAFEAQETLDTVTTRGNITINDITVGALFADSATFTSDVVVGGNLIVNGTTTTINSTELLIDDKTITVASGATTPAEADSSGIIIDGTDGASMLYRGATDTFDFNRGVILDSTLEVTNNATFNGKVTLNDVDPGVSTTALFLDETTGQIITTTIISDGGEGSTTIVVVPATDSEYYPTLVRSVSGEDSVHVDAALSYNNVLNRLTTGNLRIDEIALNETQELVLVVDSSRDVAFRNINTFGFLDSEQDTLATVTARGDSTSVAITVGALTAQDSVVAGGDMKFGGGLYDIVDRRLIIYDSAGEVLWGA